MAKLVWDEVGERFYESGVSQGVFYGSDKRGVPWNGLISVEETNNDATEPLYFDGFKYADVVTVGDFRGKITAFTYPDEFLPYEGVQAWEPGFYLTDQPKQRFGLSYKTDVNNDQTQGVGYKLHILYNVLAIPSNKTYETLSLQTDPIDFEWDISAVPVRIDRFRPTAHVIIDSRKIDSFLLADIENLLYGSDELEPTLPELSGLVNFVQKWGRFIVNNNGDGTWTATSPLDGVIEMLDEETFTITYDTAVYIDSESYTLTSSEVDYEDLGP